MQFINSQSPLPFQVCTTIHRQECAPITKQHCTVTDEPICDTVYEVKNILKSVLKKFLFSGCVYHSARAGLSDR